MWQRRGDLRAWLFSILHNLFIDRVRAGRAAQENLTVDEDMLDAPTRPTQTDMLEVRDLDRALLRLSPEQREVLLLVAVEQMTYQQVGAVLAVPLGTVMSRLSRARERLRMAIETDDSVSKLKVVR